ncbi:hypothetical protein [Paludisphaera soli]|uniref:hypothetical protein n=1 Tax=Paludisphaera soli TaxID=2712865 RepID=UPI0013EC1B2E|nr:hypothetical protein [Paludisphaera soli]
MCLGIALIGSELPTELVGRHDLAGRLHVRAGRPEYRFLYREPRPRLPIVRDGVLRLARWGNHTRRSLTLPRTGWTWQESVEKGLWARSGAIFVDIPANFGLERRGVWYAIEVGIKGLLVSDEYGRAVAYMICEPSSHYYRVMTGSDRMPVFIGQKI